MPASLDELIALLMAGKQQPQQPNPLRFGGGAETLGPAMGGAQGPLTPDSAPMRGPAPTYQPQDINEARAEMTGAQPANPLGFDMPSRFDFANAGLPASARLPSRFDFANAAGPPTPSPRPEPSVSSSPAPTAAPAAATSPAAAGPATTAAASPERAALASAMMQPPEDRAGYTTSGTNPIYRGGSSAIFGRNRKK